MRKVCLGPIAQIRWDKIVVAGIIYALISQVVRTIEATLTMSYYQDPAYFGVWSKIMMPGAGAPPTSFFVWSIIFAFTIGIVLAVFYEWVKKILPEKSMMGKACDYTTVVSILTLVLAYFPMYLLINLPLGLLIVWFLSTVVILYLSALVFVKILK